MPRYAKFGDEVFRESDAYVEVVCGYLNDNLKGALIQAWISTPDEIVVTQLVPESNRLEDTPVYVQYHVRIRGEIVEVLISDSGGLCQVVHTIELCDPNSLDNLVKWFEISQI